MRKRIVIIIVLVGALMAGSKIILESISEPALAYDAPTGLAADVGGEYKVDLTWTDNATGEDGYQAFSSLDQVEWRLCGTSAANTEEMTAQGFEHNTDWYFKVRAFGANGYSDFSGTATVNIPDVGVSNIAITTLVTGDPGDGDWHGRCAMKTLDSGVTVMVYHTGTTSSSNDDQVHIRFSDDGGATWTAEDTKLGGGAVTGFPMYPPGAAPGDAYSPSEPWLYLAPNGDLLLHTWKIDIGTDNKGSWQSVSSDDGESWGAMAQIDFVGIADDDPEWSTMDDFVYGGVIYAALEGGEGYQLIKSDDNGVSWDLVSDWNNPARWCFEPGIEYIGDNSLVVIMGGYALKLGISSYKFLSDDFGATWGDQLDVGPDLYSIERLATASRVRLYTAAHIRGEADWWEDPTLIMVGFQRTTPLVSTGRINSIWVSRDRGDTWAGPFALDIEYEHGGYGDIKYDSATGKYFVVTSRGTLLASDVIQYKFDIDNLP